MFIRSFNEKLIKLLGESDLYKRKISKDIKEGVIFPAIRDERIDFYHKGGKLFTYDGEFKTHIKYASVYRLDEEKNYVTEKDLSAPQKCDFIEDYTRIKENCSMFAEQEAVGVSRVYSKYSYAKMKSGAMVLDIEVSFKSNEEGRTQDRIDLLISNNGMLRFYEAKHFSNSEIWAKLGLLPKVPNQVVRYKKQIEDNEINIITQYQNYIKIVNEIFGLDVVVPQNVDHNVPVLVFGFDRDQQQGRFKKLFEGNLKGKISYYAIGDVSKININTMWNACNS